jgi:hypothetical protein
MNTSSTQLDDKFILKFDQPKKRTKFETISKFIHEDSLVYFFIKDAQEKLKHSGIRLTDRMEPCIQILSQEEKKLDNNLNLFLKRVEALQGQELLLDNRDSYKTKGRQLVFTFNTRSQPTIEEIIDNKIEYQIVICTLPHLALNKDKYLNIILNKNYSTWTDHEDTGVSNLY